MTTQKTDYTSEGLARLLTTLQGGPGTEALLAAFTDRAQEFEDAAYPLRAQWDLNTATGDRLDRIGELFVVQRAGRTDEPYRLRLRAEIAILTSIGTEFDLVRVAQLLLDAEAKTGMSYYEFFPKTAFVAVLNDIAPGTVADQAIAAALLQRAAPAGTNTHLVYTLSETASDNVFRFSSVASTTEALATYGTESGSLAGIA